MAQMLKKARSWNMENWGRNAKTAITFGMCLNIALLAANGFLVTKIDNDTTSHGTYIGIWLVCFLVVFALAFGTGLYLLSKYPEHHADYELLTPSANGHDPTREQLRELEKWKRNYSNLQQIIAIVIESAIFALVLAYFWKVALHKRQSASWEMDVEVASSGLQPAVLIGSNPGDGASASLDSMGYGFTKCFFPAYSKDNSTSCGNNFWNSTSDTAAGNTSTKYYLFKPNMSGNVLPEFTQLSDQIELQTWVTWNSKDASDDYATNATQNPYLYVAVFDPSVEFETAMSCNMLAYTVIPALGSTTLTISAHGIWDDRKAINWTNGSCASTFAKRKPYLQYQLSISSTGSAAGYVCDTANATTDPQCTSDILVRYSSFTTTTSKSVPGIEIVDIWINEGAIVGAVLMLGYFATVYSI